MEHGNVVGIGWYLPEQWDKLREISADRGDLEETFSEWEINAECKSCPILVRDFKIKYDEGQWQELTETRFTEKKLTQLIRRLDGAGLEVEHLARRLAERQRAST